MQASNDTIISDSNEPPFVLVEKSNQQDKGNSTSTHQPSWDFEISTGNKKIALKLIVNNDKAALSDLVPVSQQICDMINRHATENESKKGNEISCQKGCANCCSYMVSLSSAEAFYMQKHIMKLPRGKRRHLQHSFLRAARKIAANKVPPYLDETMDESECLKSLANWYQKMEIMPTNACQWFYECDQCKTLLKPLSGDCCVFCSYGTVKCPPIQEGCVDCS